MAATLGRTASSGTGKPDWSPVPPRPPRSRRFAMARRALGAAVVAALMWKLAHPIAAVVLLAVMLLVTLACEASPRFAARLQDLEERFQKAVGRVLSLLLMAVLQFLVFTPLWLVLKLLRRDALDVGARTSEGSAWSLAPRRTKGRPLFERPFAYERVTGAASRGLRVRAAVGVVALALLLDIGVGALLGSDTPARKSAAERLNLLGAPGAAAGRGEPWRVELGEELDQAWTGRRYDPFLGWTMPDLDGRYVKVKGGVRESRQAAGGSGRPVEIFFFGGSAMFGLFQRDQHTIPSEFARLAQHDGLRLKVENYGRLAYVNWQEQLLMEQLASRGEVPDLAVFYDGFNELVSQFQLGPHREPSHVAAAEIAALLEQAKEDPSGKSALRRLYDDWGDVSAVRGAARDLGIGSRAASTDSGGLTGLTSPWAGDQSDRPQRRGRYAADIYGRGRDLIRRLGAGYGFDARFFWQPSIYSKRVYPGEQSLEGWLGADPEAWRAANREARSRLGRSVTDLSGALDAARSPVMYDFVHTNELGARVVAAALYKRLRPDLLRLARKGGS